MFVIATFKLFEICLGRISVVPLFYEIVGNLLTANVIHDSIVDTYVYNHAFTHSLPKLVFGSMCLSPLIECVHVS